MAIYIYNQDGTLYSWVPTDDLSLVASDTELALNGLAKVEGLPPLDEMHVWNPATLTVDTLAAPPPPTVTAAQFAMLFTPAEFVTLTTSPDAGVQQAIFAVKVSQSINLADPIVTHMVAHLVEVGLVTQERANDILVGKAPV